MWVVYIYDSDYIWHLDKVVTLYSLVLFCTWKREGEDQLKLRSI